MRQQLTDLAAQEPMFFVAALASVVGMTLFWLYGGFLEQNYTKIKWFRRLFLPHISHLIARIDNEYEEVDLDHIYTETTVYDDEFVFDLYLPEEVTKEEAHRQIGDELIENHFRPEVLLASLASTQGGNPELGNFVLTAPEKNHPDTTGFGRLYDLFVMFVSKWQLHTRYYYVSDKHKISFYAHKELNPYNPLYALAHLRAEDFRQEEGVEMFKEYKDELEQYGVEIVE